MQRTDIFMNATSIDHFMQNNLAMFAEVANAPELNSTFCGVPIFSLGL